MTVKEWCSDQELIDLHKIFHADKNLNAFKFYEGKHCDVRADSFGKLRLHFNFVLTVEEWNWIQARRPKVEEEIEEEEEVTDTPDEERQSAK